MSVPKTISIAEFRFWLEGVEEMQDEGWSPTPAQWQRIREKIEMLSDNSAPKHVLREVAPQHTTIVNTSTASEQSSDINRLLSPPPSRGPVNPTPGSGFMPTNPNMPAVTPSNTEGGPYKSGFV